MPVQSAPGAIGDLEGVLRAERAHLRDLLGTAPSSPLPPDMYSPGDVPAFVHPVPSGWPALVELAVAVTAATPVSASGVAAMTTSLFIDPPTVGLVRMRDQRESSKRRAGNPAYTNRRTHSPGQVSLPTRTSWTRREGLRKLLIANLCEYTKYNAEVLHTLSTCLPAGSRLRSAPRCRCADTRFQDERTRGPSRPSRIPRPPLLTTASDRIVHRHEHGGETRQPPITTRPSVTVWSRRHNTKFRRRIVDSVIRAERREAARISVVIDRLIPWICQ